MSQLLHQLLEQVCLYLCVYFSTATTPPHRNVTGGKVQAAADKVAPGMPRCSKVLIHGQ